VSSSFFKNSFMVMFTSSGVTKYCTLPFSVVLKARPSAYPFGVTATVTTLSGIDSLRVLIV
jgi:hypothetical protein